MSTILCIDDEPASGVVLEHALAQLGHQPILATSIEEGLQAVARESVDLIISEFRTPRGSGLDLLELLREQGQEIPVILMAGASSVEHAVLSMRRGAVDYIAKPPRLDALRAAVDHAIQLTRVRRDTEEVRREIRSAAGTRAIVGASAALQQVLDTIAAAAPTRATVLLEGESGTGKELFARALHAQSPRHAGPFVTVNCAALPEGLVESVLFGHERGAFTGATARAPGAFERAHRGTLLLDEISEMRLDLQAKLLRVLQEQEFERVGGQQPVRVDVRVVATTNRRLEDEVEAGRFRSDLFYRVRVVPIRTPALRERPDDIPLLVEHFAAKTAAELGVPAPALTADALAALVRRPWPGNVRELANTVERAVILHRDGALTPAAFGYEAVRPALQVLPVLPADTETEAFDLRRLEAETIRRALTATGGHRTRAAELLGISERTLRNKLNGSGRPAGASLAA